MIFGEGEGEMIVEFGCIFADSKKTIGKILLTPQKILLLIKMSHYLIN